MTRARLPLLSASDVRVTFAAILLAAHLGAGIEPGLQGLAGDRGVRLVGVLAGWTGSFAACLAFATLGFFLVRSVLVARASFGRSLLTGASAAAAAFALTALVAGHPGPASRVLLAAVALAILGARAVAGPTFARLLPAVVIAVLAFAHALAGRAFEHGGVAFWALARAASTAAWVGQMALFGIVAHRLGRARRPVVLGCVLAFGLLVVGARAGDAYLGEAESAFVRRALAHGSLPVPPFGLGVLALWAPLVLRLMAWVAVVAMPVELVALPVLVAFVPALPSPLAALAVLLACHVDATGCDDDTGSETA